jgi:hypothetical protein
VKKEEMTFISPVKLEIYQPQTIKKSGGAESDLRFSGVTAALQDKRWISPSTFQKLLNVSSTPYVGRLPSEFTSLMQESPKHVYQALDELVPFLRGLAGLPDVSFEFHIGHSNKSMTLQYAGRGSFGTVYQFTVNNHPFALKVYHSDKGVLTHGTFGESATGLYFSKKVLKDISRFYFGNPKSGWGVFEFITQDISADKRKGGSIKDYPVSLEDDHGANSIHGIRVDYGGISKTNKTVTISNFDDYKKAMETQEPTVQARAASQIGVLPNELRQAAFQLAMDSKEPTVQLSAASQIGVLPNEFRKDAFQLAMDSKEPTVQASAASQIRSLPNEFIKAAFQLAMDSKEPTVQASAAIQIGVLPNEFRQAAFQIYIYAMEKNHSLNYPDPKVKNGKTMQK